MATRNEIDQEAAALRKRGYLPTAELCDAIGKSRSHFDKELKRSIPSTAIETLDDGSKLYFARVVVDVLVERARERSARGKNESDPETESSLRESKIERAQRQNRMEELRFEHFEMKQRIASGELLLLAEVKAKFAPLAIRIRQFSDRSGRRERMQGEDVKRSLHAIADAIEKAVEKLPE